MNDLLGLTIDRDQCRSQNFMAATNGIQALGQGGKVQDSRKPNGTGEIVGRTFRFELLQKPQPLLGKGQRNGI